MFTPSNPYLLPSKTLEGTILKEHLKNVTLVKKAVSNLAGNIEIHMPGDDHARPSIGSPKRKSWDISENIRSFLVKLLPLTCTCMKTVWNVSTFSKLM